MCVGGPAFATFNSPAPFDPGRLSPQVRQIGPCFGFRVSLAPPNICAPNFREKSLFFDLLYRIGKVLVPPFEAQQLVLMLPAEYLPELTLLQIDSCGPHSNRNPHRLSANGESASRVMRASFANQHSHVSPRAHPLQP